MTEPYTPKYPQRSKVRVADSAALEAFRREWKLHHPLTDEQLSCAGREGLVAEVAFYHGGDVLYRIEGLPGTWHEPCLVSIDAGAI